MKTIPTKEQMLDALQTHKTVQKAANALGVKYPEMQKYLKKYGIGIVSSRDLPAFPSKPLLVEKIEYPFSEEEVRKPWYKRLLHL